MSLHWKEQLRRKRRVRGFSRAYEKSKVARSKRVAKLSKLVFIVGICGFVLLIVMFSVLAFTLPSPEKIVRQDGFSTKILDRDGKVLYDIYTNQRRTKVSLAEIPDDLKHATIAVEDKNFYKHKGFDMTGYFRAIFSIIFRGRIQGGSTLTQQLVKTVLLSPEQTIIRKVKELVLTLQIESKYSKDEILGFYLNEVPYGGTAFGVEAASEIYFGKKVNELSLVQCAILAGLPQRPTYYSPYSSNPKAYIGRTQGVLRRMREDGYITKEQEEESLAQLESVEFQARGASFKAPHFVQYIQGILEERYGAQVIETGGLKVTTTLSLDIQEKAQEIVSEEIEKVASAKIGNGATVVLDSQTGEILAMVGSKNFNAPDYDGQVNVVMSLRQPGSAIKPITYVTALEKGYTASTLFADVPTIFPGGENLPEYKPVNYDGKYRGPVQLRYSLANSLNIPAVKTLALVGVRDVLEKGFDMGITSLEPTKETMSRVGLSLTLGGGEVRLLELTGAYGAFMNGGKKLEPSAILKIEDRNGKVLEENTPEAKKQVISPEHAFIIADILSDNNARSEVFGVNSLLNISGKKVAVKTGTTNDKRDNWTIGGNPQVTVGVWVGNNDNSPMLSVASGVSGASPIWRRVLMASLEGRPNVGFEQPEGIVSAQVDSVSGYREHDGFPSRTEYFVKGTEPGEDTVHVKLKVCKGDSRLATPSDVAAGNYDEKEFIVLKEEDPTAAPGGQNKWQEGILAWIGEQSDTRYKFPTEYCSGVNSAPLNVDFISPRDRDSNLSGNITIKFKVDSVHGVSLAELEIDGVKVRSFTGGPYEYEASLSDGVHSVRAIGHDSKGNQSDRKIVIGVGVAWDSASAP